MALSMNSIVGFIENKTVQLKGKIYDNEVLILIDSRASCNFISTGLVETLQISVDSRNKFEVQVGDGYLVRGVGVCHNVVVEMQGIRVQQTFYPFDFRGHIWC